MRFGSTVWVRRGSHLIPAGEIGHERWVRGVLIGRNKWHAIVRLAEDDPFASVGYCTKAGDVGRWGNSCVRREPGE